MISLPKIAVAALALLMGARAVRANMQNLIVDNSIVTVDDSTFYQMADWYLNGPGDWSGGQMVFWRIGDTGGEACLPCVGLQNANMPTSAQLDLTYASTNSPFSASVSYSLTGGPLGTPTASVVQLLQLSNTSSETLNFHLFFYTLYTLNSTAQDQSLSVSSDGTANQIDGNAFAATAVSLLPTHVQALNEEFAFNFFDSDPTTVGDNLGPVGPGVLSTAYQWDFDLEPEATWELTLTHTMGVVPEPSTWLLMAIGFMGVCGRRLLKAKAAVR